MPRVVKSLFVICSLLLAQQGLAQREPPAAKLDMASAQAAMAAALAEADRTDSNVSIAILDANGDLVMFVRKDGASPRAVTTSQGKARASLVFGLPSREVQTAIASGEPLTAVISAPPAGAWELTPFQGALPIYRDSEIIGAIGVGGVAPARDEEIARAGVEAID